MTQKHDYETTIRWTGNRGQGTKTYHGYDRNWDLAGEGKPVVSCSNDPLLGGNAGKYNPEDLPEEWLRTGRNAPCPCGSGKKFKHCHGKYV